MNPFKRLCLLIFGLSGIFCLIALAMPWFGPYQPGGMALMGQQGWYYAVEATGVITAIGILASFLRGIFAPHNRKTVIISKQDGDQITVTRNAIASQAQHLVEEDGAFTSERVEVRAKKYGHIRVFARVKPKYTVDVVAAGEKLHERLLEGLKVVCGDNVDSVELEFVDAENHDMQDQDADDLDVSSFAESYAAYKNAGGDDDGAAGAQASDALPETTDAAAASVEDAPAADPDTTSDITVPMTHVGRSGAAHEDGEA